MAGSGVRFGPRQLVPHAGHVDPLRYGLMADQDSSRPPQVGRASAALGVLSALTYLNLTGESAEFLVDEEDTTEAVRVLLYWYSEALRDLAEIKGKTVEELIQERAITVARRTHGVEA